MKNFQITNKNGIKLRTSNKYVDDDINVSIDAINLVPENIKEGVEILGITGTFEGGTPGTHYYIYDSTNKYKFDITTDEANISHIDIRSSLIDNTNINIYATQANTNLSLNGGSNENLIGTINIDDTNYTGSIIADNLVPENIKEGIKILGVTGTMQSSSGSSTETTLKTLLDATQSASYLFWNYSGTSIDGLIKKNDTTNIKDTSYMFQSCKNLISIPELNTGNVINMRSMFYNCTSLTTIPQLDTINVQDMRSMFHNCFLLKKIDITYMYPLSTPSYFAYCCYSLTKVIIRYMTQVPLLDTNSFLYCYHFSGKVNSTYNPNGLKDGRIYVPDDMVNTLKSATNWSTYADIIVPLSTLEEE